MMGRGSLILTQGAKQLQKLGALMPTPGPGHATGTQLSGAVPSSPPNSNSFLGMPSRGVGTVTAQAYDTKTGAYMLPQTGTAFGPYYGSPLPMPHLVARLPPGAVVMDIGAGTGTSIPKLVQAASAVGGRVVAIEPDKSSFEGIGTKKDGALQAGLKEYNCLTVHRQAEAMVLYAGQADYVQAIRVAPYIEDKKAWVSSIVSTLKPGGAAYIDFYHPTAKMDGRDLHAQSLFEFSRDAGLDELAGAHVESISLHADVRDTNNKAVKVANLPNIDPADLFEVNFSTVPPDRTINEAMMPYKHHPVADVRVQLVIRRDPEPASA